MTLLEFLSFGLQYGQKVTLYLKHAFDDKTEKTDCFFVGFRNFMCRTRALSEEEIIPVFFKCSKNGKMISSNLGRSTALRYIVSVTPHGNNAGNQIYRKLGESRAMEETERRLSEDAYRQIKEILFEMNVLFPGRKIILNRKFGSATAYQDDDNGYGLSGDVAAAGWKDDEPVFDLDFTFSFKKEQSIQRFDVDSWHRLLSAILDSIENPSEEEGNFIDLMTATWKDIPFIDRHFPALVRNEALARLRNRLWFESMDAAAKEEKFGRFRTKYEDKKEEGYKGTFPEFIDSFWNGLCTIDRDLILKEAELGTPVPGTRYVVSTWPESQEYCGGCPGCILIAPPKGLELELDSSYLVPEILCGPIDAGEAYIRVPWPESQKWNDAKSENPDDILHDYDTQDAYVRESILNKD